jgi:hypothetical protein
LVEPGFDLIEIEAQKVAPLEVGDTVLGDESTDMAVIDTEALSQRRQVHER